MVRSAASAAAAATPATAILSTAGAADLPAVMATRSADDGPLLVLPRITAASGRFPVTAPRSAAAAGNLNPQTTTDTAHTDSFMAANKLPSQTPEAPTATRAAATDSPAAPACTKVTPLAGTSTAASPAEAAAVAVHPGAAGAPLEATTKADVTATLAAEGAPTSAANTEASFIRCGTAAVLSLRLAATQAATAESLPNGAATFTNAFSSPGTKMPTAHVAADIAFAKTPITQLADDTAAAVTPNASACTESTLRAAANPGSPKAAVCNSVAAAVSLAPVPSLQVDSAATANAVQPDTPATAGAVQQHTPATAGAFRPNTTANAAQRHIFATAGAIQQGAPATVGQRQQDAPLTPAKVACFNASAGLQTVNFSSNGSTAIPCNIAAFVTQANAQLQAHQHVAPEQMAMLEEVLGDVQTLLDIDNDSLNDVLRNDGKLRGIQVVVVRRMLRQLRLKLQSGVC